MKECCSVCQVVPCAFDLLHDDVISGDPEKQVLGEKEEGVSGLPAAQGLPHTVRLKLQRTSYRSGQSKHKLTNFYMQSGDRQACPANVEDA